MKPAPSAPASAKPPDLKLVYSPLNGSGHGAGHAGCFIDIGIDDITIVPEQQYPDGNFPTCPYPNPEIFEALRLGLELAEKTGADLMLATDPDADRVGIAIRCPDGSYELVSGNEVGVLLLDYICQGRIEKGTMPKRPVAVKSSGLHPSRGHRGRGLRRGNAQRSHRLQVDRRPDRQAGGRR